MLEAVSRGEFDDLPGAGRPLDLNDDPLVPQELRVAYRILKNAGYLPPEVGAVNEMSSSSALSRRRAATSQVHAPKLRRSWRYCVPESKAAITRGWPDA
jgi:hypothetical protein